MSLLKLLYFFIRCNLVDGFFFLFVYFCYVCHAEVNAILNTNHASAAGQVSSTALSSYHIVQMSYLIENTDLWFIYHFPFVISNWTIYWHTQ